MSIALSQRSSSEGWLAQFETEDAKLAAHLADSFLVVGRDEFAGSIFDEFDRVYNSQGLEAPPLALYAERPLKKVFGNVPAYFPRSRGGRASGPGVQPVIADARNQEVGSEAIIANLITSYTRSKPSAALSHPGPSKLREAKVRTIVIVTDFIGSGDRILRNLESFALVKTLQSWRSYGLIKFVVIAYSGTKSGIRAVKGHRLRPLTYLISGCPTIKSEFRGKERNAIMALCAKYPPKHTRGLGWGGTGAMIAFAHGVPNNVPALFHSSKNGWQPLFVKRSTIATDSAFVGASALSNSMDRAEKLLAIRLAKQFLLDEESTRWLQSMMVLAACHNGRRTDDEISAKTAIRRRDVAEFCNKLKTAGWLNDDRRITAVGLHELARLRKKRRRKPVFPIGNQSFYYPTQLRVP